MFRLVGVAGVEPAVTPTPRVRVSDTLYPAFPNHHIKKNVRGQKISLFSRGFFKKRIKKGYRINIFYSYPLFCLRVHKSGLAWFRTINEHFMVF